MDFLNNTALERAFYSFQSQTAGALESFATNISRFNRGTIGRILNLSNPLWAHYARIFGTGLVSRVERYMFQCIKQFN